MSWLRSVVSRAKSALPGPFQQGFETIRSLDWLPYGPVFDYLWALGRFRKINRRFPRRSSPLFFDELFRVRIKELRREERIAISDKELVKQFIRARVGDARNVPTVAVLRSVEEALSFSYPADCVIKPTHMAGEVIFRRDGRPVDLLRIVHWFNRNYYRVNREENYRSLSPKVIVEPFVFGPAAGVPPDYKVTCIDGEPRLIRMVAGRGDDDRRSYFDCDWRIQPFNFPYPPLPASTPRPENLDEMLAIARRLSSGFSYLRVDLYSDGNRVFVGELTNCESGAFGGPLNAPHEEAMLSSVLWPDRWGGETRQWRPRVHHGVRSSPRPGQILRPTDRT
jgi:hypothetical protein